MLRLVIAIVLIGLSYEEVVKTPKHVDRGFTAVKAIVVNDSYIGFEKLVQDINVGVNYFNNEYGFFRAEKSGMYFFSFYFVSPEESHFRISLRINGIPQVWAFSQPNYQPSGNSAVLFLQKGAVVYLYLEEGNVYEPVESPRGYGTFTGHRLSRDETEAVVPRTSTRSRVSLKAVNAFKKNFPFKWPTA